ncbi:hypothetical protein PAAG_05729 [Paracoccidioides lutzii Pb01]|uniref:Xylanolytic transcriptional activator regulatory domain-containing protein n=1 Tax=Paracoccidioides lutzii (strain ATCC MYA-826 / Pb01) TaxID=502779 RepID=C1H4N6_PARBA|nr:hypothetical protein PAAG_05729 [Paracoccidioides lutzii Pb01]EEH34680.2 hypothetical protein PAAG_05729 [Paracoccidioides lutzii Pb01]
MNPNNCNCTTQSSNLTPWNLHNVRGSGPGWHAPCAMSVKFVATSLFMEVPARIVGSMATSALLGRVSVKDAHLQTDALLHKSHPTSRMRLMESIVSQPGFPQYVNPARQPSFSLFCDIRGEKEFGFEHFGGMNPQIPRNILPSSADGPNGTSGVIFSFYRFVELRNLHTLSTEDVKYLEMKGSLHLPAAPILHEFVREYFLHVHPCLPILNEADFWSMYSNRTEGSTKPRAISLFIVQARFFASCAFVPSDIIQSAGFADNRTARNILYRRAKLLFDLDAENDALAKAQGSIILTYQSSHTDVHAGSRWLTNAIQNAILHGAHLYNSKSNQSDPQKMTKKRLWWSIILRDRILLLGLRRHPQITPQNFDLPLDCLSEEDFEDEVYNSEVYSPETKRLLANVMRVQYQLAIALTDVYDDCIPAAWVLPTKSADREGFVTAIRDKGDIRDSLTQWANEAEASTGRLALCHNETLTLEAHQRFIADTYSKRLEEIKEELEEAALGITRSVKRLLMRGVARHLPISAVAYTALPLVLNALDVKLSGTTSQSATHKRQLGYYVEVMQFYRNRYDGTDYVAFLIQQVLKFAESQNLTVSFQASAGTNVMSNSTNNDSDVSGDTNTSTALTERSNSDKFAENGTKSWGEILVRHPRLYLRLSLPLDIAFARGQFPRDADLPSLVREFRLKDDSGPSVETMEATIPMEFRMKDLPPPMDSLSKPPSQQKQEQQQQRAYKQSDDPPATKNTDVYYHINDMVELPNPERQQQQQQKVSTPRFSSQFSVSNKLAQVDQLVPAYPMVSQDNFGEVNLDFLDMDIPLLSSLGNRNDLDIGSDNSWEDGDANIQNALGPAWMEVMLNEIPSAIPA